MGSSDEGHALLLAKRHHANLLLFLIGNAKTLEPAIDLRIGGKACEAVLDLNIFPRREFRKQAQLLKQIADVATAELSPFPHRELLGRAAIHKKFARIVVAIADEIAAKGALTHTAIGLDEIFPAFLERHLLLPYLRVQVGSVCKNLWKHVAQLNCIHD